MMSFYEGYKNVGRPATLRKGGLRTARTNLTRSALLQTLAALLTSRHYVVRGDSMAAAFGSGHLLLVRRVPPSGLCRGDLVIIRDPRDPKSRYLKRIVGLPGERIQFFEGLLRVDGEHLVEPYIGGLPASLGVEENMWSLAEGEYFVLGDNRGRSTDSRAFGPVDAGLIVGQVWFRYWPLDKWGRVR